MHSHPAHKRRQTGQATIEWLYVIPVLLLVFLAALQLMFIYEAKQTLSYAVFIGTRQGALYGGDMDAIKDGVAAGLAPLFVHGDNTSGGGGKDDLTELKIARRVALSELITPNLALFQIVNPTPDMVTAFGGTIPNDNLMYRSDEVKGGVNVQDANLLKVRVTYCVRLVVPLVNRMIYAFAVAPPAVPDKADSLTAGQKYSPSELLKATTGPGPSGGLCVGSDKDPYPYRIPVTAEAVIRMQSSFTGDASTTSSDDSDD